VPQTKGGDGHHRDPALINQEGKLIGAMGRAPVLDNPEPPRRELLRDPMVKKDDAVGDVLQRGPRRRAGSGAPGLGAAYWPHRYVLLTMLTHPGLAARAASRRGARCERDNAENHLHGSGALHAALIWVPIVLVLVLVLVLGSRPPPRFRI
jgi:hypothetical protein